MVQRSPCLYRRPSPNQDLRSAQRRGLETPRRKSQWSVVIQCKQGEIRIHASRPTLHASRSRRHLCSAELFEPESERGEPDARVLRGIGPDGEEAAVGDFLESAQVFFPIECPGWKAKAAGIRGRPAG